jgi:hypothetical protein
MQWVASVFVGKPLNVAVIAAVFLAGHVALRASAAGAARRPRMLLIAGWAWLAYAAWEWLVQARTPGANIRVDLLVIWPVLVVLSLWAVYRALR